METQSSENDDEILQGYVEEQDNLEWMALCHILIKEILDGNEARCYQDFRVTKSVFMNLYSDLNKNYGLHPTRKMTIHEEVGIFLMTCAYGVGNRIIQEMLTIQDYIGAIDGTHVAARLPRGQEIAYFGRKGYATQNILAVIDFNVFHICMGRMGRICS
ncbi:hypothetical protein LIER_36690 [Lithospermum erythrorhizon]|uniref:DUF8040 domain-containing protein n=1 Tax=Lithospermum erythrorhizon TaxID=34254 RepID=A0AAV3PBH0_LITER